MFESPVKSRDLVLFSFLSSMVVLCVFITSYFNDRTKIVFCDVGQGDATYIRIKNEIDVLIDAGPDKSVLSCLGKYMPFWDRKIELAFLSHPNNDHYNGYFFIADRYKINKFITIDTSGLIVSKTYKKLLSKISEKNIPLLFKVASDQIKAEDTQLTLYWPPKGFNSSNDNDYSHILLFQESNFRLLFTGDASSFVLNRLPHGAIGKIDVLKIPHHGSKNGLTKKFLDLADPSVGVISAGKNNSYGHPNQVVLDMLKAKNINIRRTDEEGDIIFKIQGTKSK